MAEGKAKKKNVFSKIGSFFRSCIGEIGKITWPAVPATFKNFGIVVLVILVVGIFIFSLDTLLFWLLGLVMNPGSSVIS